MNYELISKMTFAELRSLEYDLNRIKNERSGWGCTKDNEYIKKQTLESYSKQDKKSDEEWAATLRNKEIEKTYKLRVNAFDITAVSKLPNMIGNLILEFVGIEKNHQQNHFIREQYTNDNNQLCKKVLSLAREKASAIHQANCCVNFGKMKMKKIKELFTNNISLNNLKMLYNVRMNSKENFIIDIIKVWKSPRWDLSNYKLTLLIASTR
jgi:hypothetical protein